MKTYRNLIPVVALLSLTVGPLAGQEEDDERRNPRRNREQMERQQQFDVQQALRRFDKDGDNALTKEELPARLQDGFQRVDRNGDSKLDRQELRQHALRMNASADQGQNAYIMVYRAAVDPLTLQDVQNSYSMLRMIDQNDDGTISREEIQQAQEQIRKRHSESVMQEWDRNKDNKLSRDEAGGFLKDEDRFNRIDRNSDDSISADEMEQAFVNQRGDRGERGERDRDRNRDRDRDDD